MASITIRNLDSALKERLRVRAAQHGHSMEQEARDLLRVALNRKIAARGSLHDKINERFGELGGVELPKLKRQAMQKRYFTSDFSSRS